MGVGRRDNPPATDTRAKSPTPTGGVLKTYLPALRTLLRESSEGNGFIGVLLSVLFPARLNEVGVRRHAPAWLVCLGPRHPGRCAETKCLIREATLDPIDSTIKNTVVSTVLHKLRFNKTPIPALMSPSPYLSIAQRRRVNQQ